MEPGRAKSFKNKNPFQSIPLHPNPFHVLHNVLTEANKNTHSISLFACWEILHVLTQSENEVKKYASFSEAMSFEHAAVLILSCLCSNYWPSVNKLCV